MERLRKILFGITGLLLIAVVSVIALRVRWIPAETDVSKTGVIVNSNSGLLVAFDTAASTTALIRLVDGVRQEFKGSWGVNFISPSRTAVFGQFAESPERHNLFLFDGMGGKQIDISTLPGVITHVAANPNQTYLLITGITDAESYSCVVDIATIPFVCRNVVTDLLGYEKDAVGPFIAWWNSEKAHELVIIRGEDARERFVMDMWDDERPREVNGEVIEHLLERFEAGKKTLASSEFLFKKSGPLLRVTDKKTGEWFHVAVYPWADVQQVTPNAVVIIRDGQVEILNAASKKRFEFPKFENDVQFKTYFGDL